MQTIPHTSKQSVIDRSFAFMESLPIGDRFLLKGTLTVLVLSLMWLFVSVNAATLIDIPGRGGTLSEGVIGSPRFINPILAVTGADQDLTALIYAGIMTLGPDGALVPNIAESVTVSEDGLVYTVRLEQGVTFHDGAPLTTDDVVFTVARIQDLKVPCAQAGTGFPWNKSMRTRCVLC